MNRFKQCTYSLILILTCFVASPMIYKQIWNTSAEKKKENSSKTVEIDIKKGMDNTSQSENPSGEQNTSSNTDNSESTVNSEENSADNSTADTTSEPSSDPSANFTGFVASDYSYFNDALFIGDSRTVGLRDYGSLGNSDFFCDVGLTSGDASSSAESGNLADMLSSNNYGKIYVMLGINEVGNNFDSTMNNFRSLVQNIRTKSPDSIIFLEANLHVTDAAQNDAINNQRINELNSMIAALADNQSVFYIDINPVFDDGNGNLMADCTSDGVHVFAKYYPQWCDWFCLNTVPKN